MNEQPEVAAAAAAFGVLIFFGGLAAWTNRRRHASRLRRHVANFVQTAEPGSENALKTADPSEMAAGLNRRMGNTSLAKQLQIQLVRSGLTITPNQFILGQLGLGAILFLVGRYILFSSQGLALLFSLGMVVPVIVLPRFVLGYLMSRRVNRFENQLAQAVDVMAGALQAGSSLTQSFGLVSREMPNPIGEEFGRVMQEAAVGVPLEQALRNMLERVPSMDLDMLVTAINIQYRVGGNLSHILKTIAHTIRERVRIRGELSTLTAQARMSRNIITGLPVVVVLALMVVSPTYIMKLFDPGVTRVMLIMGVMGIISGFYVMKKIATIEV